MTSTPTVPRLLTTREACEALRISRGTLVKLRRIGSAIAPCTLRRALFDSLLTKSNGLSPSRKTQV